MTNEEQYERMNDIGREVHAVLQKHQILSTAEIFLICYMLYEEKRIKDAVVDLHGVLSKYNCSIGEVLMITGKNVLNRAAEGQRQALRPQ